MNNLFREVTDRMIKKYRDDISDEQHQILTSMSFDTVIESIAVAEQGTAKAAIRPAFNVLDQKILQALLHVDYTEEQLSGIRAGVAFTIIEMLKDSWPEY